MGGKKQRDLNNFEFYMPLGARQAGLSSSETAASLWLKPATHSRVYTKERNHPMKDSWLLDLRWMTGPEFGLSSMKELHPSCCVWAVLLVASQRSCHSQPLVLMQTICIPLRLQWTIHVTKSWLYSNGLQSHRTSIQPITFGMMLSCQYGLKFPRNVFSIPGSGKV